MLAAEEVRAVKLNASHADVLGTKVSASARERGAHRSELGDVRAGLDDDLVVVRESDRIQHQAVSLTEVKAATEVAVFDQGLGERSAVGREDNRFTRAEFCEHEVLGIGQEVRLTNLDVEADEVGHRGDRVRVTVKHAGVGEVSLTLERVQLNVTCDLEGSCLGFAVFGFDAVESFHHVSGNSHPTKVAVVRHRDHSLDVVASLFLADHAFIRGASAKLAVRQSPAEPNESRLVLLHGEDLLQFDFFFTESDVAHDAVNFLNLECGTLHEVSGGSGDLSSFQSFDEGLN